MTDTGPAVFSGEFTVDDGSFTLEADRFIVQEGSVAFELTGYDDSGRFEASAVAQRTPTGGYLAQEVLVRYQLYNGSYRGKIQLTSVVIHPRSCDVTGVWFQAGMSWTFEGRLKRRSLASAKVKRMSARASRAR